VIRANDNCDTTRGLYVAAAGAVTMTDVDVDVGDGLIALDVNGTITARNSRFRGLRDALYYTSTTVARFVSTQLDGRLTYNVLPGSVKCVGSYNGNFDPLNAGCL
jgi:hypothetical protein